METVDFIYLAVIILTIIFSLKVVPIILFKKRKPSHYRIVDVEGRGVLFVIQGLFGKKWKDVDEDGHSGYEHYFTKLDANDAMNRFVNGIEIGSKDTIYAPFPVNNSGKLKQFPGRSNHPSPLDPQISLKDANEIAGKSAAKDAERIAELEKELDTRAMLIAKLINNKIVNTNTINRLTVENDELSDRVRELEGKSKISNKHAKTTSKNATSGK